MAFGQKPLKRIYNNGDTLTVFTIADERKIVNKLQDGKTCEKNRVIDSLIISELKDIRDLYKEKDSLCDVETSALRDALAQADTIQDRHMQQINLYKKEVKKHKRIAKGSVLGALIVLIFCAI